MAAKILSALIFLLPALALTTPYGIGFIEVAFLLVAIYYAKPLWGQREVLFGPTRWIVIAFAVNFASVLVSVIGTEFQLRTIDNPSRILLTVAVMGLIVYIKPRAEWFWHGVFVGAISTACFAVYQRIEMGIGRVVGFHNEITFGDISMSLGLMALASTRHFANTRLSPLPYIGFLAGFVAAILSGTRGAWVCALLLVIPLYLSGKRLHHTKFMLVALFAATISVIAYITPQSGVAQRIEDLFHDVDQYESGNVNTSYGLRIEAWHGAWKMFAEHPMNGVGRNNFNQALTELVSRSEVPPGVPKVMYQAHNEILHALATQGLVGGGALALLYIAPLLFFLKFLHLGASSRPYAIAGTLLVLSFVGFGMTQVIFLHHAGALFYALTVSTLAGLCVITQQEKLKYGCRENEEHNG